MPTARSKLLARDPYSGLRSPYWGLSGARNWELIQPFQRMFSTWTQSPSRPVAVNCVPLGAVPRTGAFAEGADLMLTPGRCKKMRSGFCAVEVVWRVTAQLGAKPRR